MSVNSTMDVAPLLVSRHQDEFHRALTDLYKAERSHREFLAAENARLESALDQALRKSDGTDSQVLELEHLRAELAEAHRQNLVYAADLAKSFGGERAHARALVKTHEQLNRSQKLAVLGQMVAAIAHDVNNMIGPIDAYAELLLRIPDVPDNVRKYAMRIQQAANKSISLLRSLTTFGSNRVVKRDAVHMQNIVHAVVALLEHNLSEKHVTLIVDFDPELPIIEADERQLEQVLINLIVNAQHAMEPSGGEVRIIVRAVREGIALSVSDQGHGIPAEVLAQLFEPFFTTKEPGKGTGLGLFICHDIIDRHGGRLDVQSSLGVGTTFTITLPSIEAVSIAHIPAA
jgi:signal transduction histidine kinase